MTKQFTAEELSAYIARQYGWQAPAAVMKANTWLARGDGVAVYENEDMGSQGVGECKLVSYGSTTAQLETPEPPVRLPDIGGTINWRYQLHGTYEGPVMPMPELVPADDGTPDATPLDVPAAQNPRIVGYRVSLDNKEGKGHREEWGTLKEYDAPDGGVRYLRPVLCSDILPGPIFIIDDGKTALPYYSGGHQPGMLRTDIDLSLKQTHQDRTAWERLPFEILTPFPVNPDGRMRPDGRGVIDYSDWLLGPKKCYHLKIQRAED